MKYAFAEIRRAVRPSVQGLIDDGAYHQQVLLPARMLLSLATNSHYSGINQEP